MTELQQAKALQASINSGLVWRLEGAAGRAAMDNIKAGVVMCAHEPGTDYWGNRVPSRHELQEGTFGTQAYVAEQMGQRWANALAKVK